MGHPCYSLLLFDTRPFKTIEAPAYMIRVWSTGGSRYSKPFSPAAPWAKNLEKQMLMGRKVNGAQGTRETCGHITSTIDTVDLQLGSR